MSKLVTQLHQEATLRSRGKRDNEIADEKERTHRGPTFRRAENYAANNDRTPEQEPCPLGCTSQHQLAACPLYQSSTVNQIWDVVEQRKRCRKCLRLRHTKECKKPDSTTSDKCQKNHHRSLHNEMINSNVSTNTMPFRMLLQKAIPTAPLTTRNIF